MKYDVIIIGAGAAGMMCAMESGKRGRRVLLLDHAKKLAEKIRISGGGRCNFTNVEVGPENYLSANPHFCRSALSRFTARDFLELLARHRIAWEERKFGQLFCANSALDIVNMLRSECEAAQVRRIGEVQIREVARREAAFHVSTDRGEYVSESLVVATGGLSIPKIGASPLGYRIAQQFGLKVTALKPGLVPLTVEGGFPELSGISCEAVATCRGKSFRDELLFTHRGLSGPVILQISSYWNPGDAISIDFLPANPGDSWILESAASKMLLSNFLPLPKKLSQFVCDRIGQDGPLNRFSSRELAALSRKLHDVVFKPGGTEGYKKAEVTVGGVDTDELSSKTMEAQRVPGLYFVGEVVDVAGQLGGFNFQWAWSSGFAAGQFA